MKRLLQIGAGVLVVMLLVVASLLGPYLLRVKHVVADASAGYSADFYFYVSPGARSRAAEGKTVTLLVQPNNSGSTSDNPDVHRKDAWWTGLERRRIADELEVVLLVPAFLRPSVDWHIYTHALDRDTLTTERTDLRRTDLQLLAMIDVLRERLGEEGITSDERILIQGFSASAMFANRFTVLHPERVKAATIGSPGGWPIAPLAEVAGETLPYPAGVADLEMLTGRPFDATTYNAIPQLIYLGSIDDNDSLDFTDGWDKEAAAQVDRLFGSDPISRWQDSESLYRQAGANAEFLLIEGIGHDRPALQSYSTEFFKKVLQDE